MTALYRLHASYVRRCVVALGCPPWLVDDAVQDVFLVVHRNLARFEHRSAVRTWLFGIARRVVSDHRRTLRRKPTEPLRATHGPCSSDPGPFERTARAEAVRIARRMLDGLGERARSILVRHDFEEVSAVAIASELDISVNTVYSRLRLARAALLRAVHAWASKEAVWAA
ncbi:MAG: sigma-70 family RNA polymerase sigma factor [Myxococcota bacterium]|nr:sigma-70 family RNA polymerase sigma factor [Myxococcota bacterium]MDW8363393.1 sigma-70 family RNA polymerase sigma factor [Myxococcales bacterium]